MCDLSYHHEKPGAVLAETAQKSAIAGDPLRSIPERFGKEHESLHLTVALPLQAHLLQGTKQLNAYKDEQAASVPGYSPFFFLFQVLISMHVECQVALRQTLEKVLRIHVTHASVGPVALVPLLH